MTARKHFLLLRYKKQPFQHNKLQHLIKKCFIVLKKTELNIYQKKD